MAESTLGDGIYDPPSSSEVETRHAFVVIGISREASIDKAVRDSRDGTVRVFVHAHSHKVCDCCMTPIARCNEGCELYENGEKVTND